MSDRKTTIRIAVGIDHLQRVNAIACHSLNREDRFAAAIGAAASGLAGNPNLYYVDVELDVPMPPQSLEVITEATVNQVNRQSEVLSTEIGRTNPVVDNGKVRR